MVNKWNWSDSGESGQVSVCVRDRSDVKQGVVVLIQHLQQEVKFCSLQMKRFRLIFISIVSLKNEQHHRFSNSGPGLRVA